MESYCWIAYGSEGRKEQTFKTDQDNAIIYDNPGTKEEEEVAEKYFSNLAVFINDSLVQFGNELEQAFEFINLLRLHHQFDQIEAGLAPDNFINLSKLSNLEKKTLKECCQLISKVQDSINKEYSPGMVL